jgi:protein O-mannosyl-transferase
VPLPTRSATRTVTFLLGVILVAAITAAYGISLRGGFLWDDDLHITANPTIVGPLGLKEIWTTARANYFPLVLTNFWAQHALWGLEPFGYRMVTLSCHIAAALLLWRVLRRLRVPGAWLGAALWALHPVQVESVAWICELKNTQSAVFFLAAIGCWIRWIEPREAGREETEKSRALSARFYALTLLCAVFAILSKPSTVMLPVALGLCTGWLRRRLEWRDALRLAPFFALSAIAAGWTIWEQKFHSGAIGPEWSQSLPERIAIAGRVIWFYLGKLAWPEPLIFIYPRWQIDASDPLAFGPAAAVVVGGVLLLWRGRTGPWRPVLFAAAYFVALLFPVLGFFSVYFFRYSFVGDHFQYLASIGPLALAGAAITRVLDRNRRGEEAIPSDSRQASLVTPAGAKITLAGGLLVVALGMLTARESRAYLNNEALWRDTVAHNPAAVMAWLNLADTYAQAGRYDEAIVTFRRALEINPADPVGWNDLGNVLVIVGRAEEAVPLFERALTLKPDYADVHSNYGNALRTLGRSDEAIAHYRRALELKPNHTGALNNLGAELAQLGKPAEALPLFEQALRIKPEDAAARDNLAGALRGLGRMDEALKEHAVALALKPDFPEAQANFGQTLLAGGRAAEALAHFERALQLKPTLSAVRGHYAAALAALGRRAEAFAQLERAVEISPNSADAHMNLGVALAQAGRTEEAITRFETALRLAPKFATAHANLGNAWSALRRWSKAITHLEAAVALQPDSPVTRAQLAVALVNDDQLAAAVPHFEAALRLNPGAAEVHNNFGQVLNALGRKREAFEHLEEAARLRRVAPR